MAVNQNIPDSWTTYVTQTNLGLEVVPAVLYDTLDLVPGTGNPPELRYFQQINVPPDISNMKVSGTLANPEAFLIQNIRIYFKYLIATTTDIPNAQIEILNTATGNLTIGNKLYGPWPLWMLGAHNQLTNAMGGATADCFYTQISGPLYPLFPNLMLSPLQPFVFTIRFGTPSAPINSPIDLGIQVLLDGQLARSIQ